MRAIHDIRAGSRLEILSMPWREYLDFPALNSGAIVAGRRSLKHLKHHWEQGREDTDALRFGRLLHCLLFEPAEVERRYRTWDGRRAGNEYAIACAEAEAAGMEIVKASGEYSMAAALEAAEGFLSCSRVQSLIRAGKAEQTVLAPECGLQCKGRLDWISTREHVLVDLKTTRTVEARLFGASFFSFGYDICLGLYQRWLSRITGERWPVEVIALESAPPYDVAVVPIPDAVLDAGAENGLKIIGRVKRALETDEWPGVAAGDYWPLHVPHWAMEEALTDDVRFGDE